VPGAAIKNTCLTVYIVLLGFSYRIFESGRSVPPVARGGPCAPPRVRFTAPSGVVVAGTAGCAVSKGLRGFMLEFTLLSFQVGYANCCRGTLLYTFGMPDFAPHFPFLWI